MPKSSEKCPPSNPVAPTTFYGPLREPKQEPLSLNLSPGSLAEALQALAQAVNALATAVSANSGQVVLRPVASLSPACDQAPPDGCTVIELVNELLRAKARAGRSDRYLRQLRVSLLSFAKGRKNHAAGAVTVQDVEAWLNSSGWMPNTQKGYLGDVRTLFNFGIKRNMVAKNPAAAVEVYSEEESPVSLHTPEQVKDVLEFARGYDLDLCRALAIRYFAGLRSCEADKLDETEIKTEQGIIDVPAAKAKTRRRRPVKIEPNLSPWLALGGSLPIKCSNNRWRLFRAALAKAHGITWPSNVTRHSFVSYHLAISGSAGKTALQAGHTEQMLFSKYREQVTDQAAAEYWRIVPNTADCEEAAA